MDNKISDPKVFEYIVFDHDPNKELMLKALELVRDFIIEKKLVITGGMAVDFAMKLKGDKLYDDKTLPDYDFFSAEHSNHAYELGQILCKNLPKLFPNYNIHLDVIPATHTTTMRVRVNYTSVADITYLPVEIFENLPVLEFSLEGLGKSLRFRHPHMQMIDQHRALSLPYENAPREVILHRWKKDMKRFDMLAKHYPVIGKDLDIDKFKEIAIDPKLLNGVCIGGFAALYLLVKKEQKNPIIKLPIINGVIEPLVIYSDQIEKTVGQLIDHFKEYKIKYFNQYLDILPSKFVLIVNSVENNVKVAETPKVKDKELFTTEMGGNADKADKLEIHVYDSANQLIAAEPHKDFYIADAQNLLSYFLATHFLSGKKVNEPSLYIDAYQTIGELVENGSRPPTFSTYGSTNLGNPNILTRAETLSRNKEIPRIKVVLKPGRFVPDETKNCAIPTNLSEFVYEESPLFAINGRETDKKPKKLVDFINPVLYDSSSDSDTEAR